MSSLVDGSLKKWEEVTLLPRKREMQRLQMFSFSGLLNSD